MRIYNVLIFIFLVSLHCLSAQTFTYDDLNRLVTADYGSGYTITYSYDKLGNRTLKMVTAGCLELNANAAYYQSFEYGLGDWSQIENDDENWTAETGTTASNATGPTSASDRGSYLYIEASNPRNSKTMTLQSGCYHLSSGGAYELSLDYHMYGTGVHRLRVLISSNGGSFATIMDESGNKGNSWQQLRYNLSAYVGQDISIRIIGQTGASGAGDIAIDNVRIGDNCTDDLVISHTLSNSHTTLPGEQFVARDKIISDATLSRGAFHFGAGQCVELDEGFEVKRGAQFMADQNGCAIPRSKLVSQEKEDFDNK